MDVTVRELRKEELLTRYGGWFDEENAERVVSWLVASEDRRPVVLVGAGYSLNARDRETGMPATRAQAPLWGDVCRRLAADVALPPERYDAPTLFELYSEALGEAKLRDALRACMADDVLTPGPAHEVLAAYSSEAIVTTNCLDTLLDKVCAVGWRRVVEDSDLSAHGQLRDLIYLHGHREYASTWVMTRSQYEDFHRAKPVIVARARQLLAQHPWLVVGFGMNDPNFHAITRLLGAEMRNQQPRSLVLMPSLPPPPERQHWQRLGFEIVAPKSDGRELGDFFAWVFPKLNTSYSPTSDGAKAYIHRAPTSVERLRRFRLVNPAPIVDRDAAYRAWEDQLKLLLTDEERGVAKENLQTAIRSLFEPHAPPHVDGNDLERTSVAPPAVPPLRSPLLHVLEEDSELNSLATDETVQCLDLLLVGNRIDCPQMAEHFSWAVQHQLFENSHRRPLMEIVAVAMAKEAGSSELQVAKLIQAAAALVRKYEHESIERVLERHVSRLGFLLPAKDVEPEEPHLIEAKAGYRAFMNAEFDLAVKHYGTAAKIAAAAGFDLEAWAYTTGRADALVAQVDATSDSESDNGASVLRDQASQLARRPVVAHWLDRADKRMQGAFLESGEGARTREYFRVTGGRGGRASNAINSAWRTYRDVQTIHAPPSLQRRYLTPVAPFMDAEDARSVIASVRDPEKWLGNQLRSVSPSLAKRQERDRKLVEGFGILNTDDSMSKTERLTSVECAPQFTSVLRKDDVASALAWLKATVTRYPEQWQVTAWDSQWIGGVYWAAFGAFAYWAEAPVALEVANVLMGWDDDRSVDEAAQALYDLPWHAWPLATEPEKAKGFLALWGQLLSAKDAGKARGRRVAHMLAGLLRMLDAGLAVETLRAEVDRWKPQLDEVRSRPRSATRFSDAKRVGYLLERELQRKQLVTAQNPSDLFEAWFGTLSTARNEAHDREELWRALAETVDAGMPSIDPMVERLGAEASNLAADDSATKRYERNPDRAASAIELLACGMQLLPASRRTIGPALLRLIAVAPEHVEQLSRTVDREFWTDCEWDMLSDLLVTLCGGGPSSFVLRRQEDAGLTTRCQQAVLGLFGKLDRKTFADEVLWHTLQGFALASVNDERRAIAYTAAFAVMEAAGCIQNPDEARLYAAAIRRIAADARVQVRSAVARDGLRLASSALSETLREAARGTVEELRLDDNAQVCTLLARAERAAARDSSKPSAPHKPNATEGSTARSIR